MNPIEITKQEEGNYYLPCGSPFQNIRPMTPIDHVIQNLYHTLNNLSIDRIYEIHQYTTNMLNNFNQYPTYDADHVDDHHKDDFQSISAKKEDINIQVKENINIDVKDIIKEEVKVQIKKEDDEKEDDDEEVSKVNSGSESGSESESEHDISESKIESKIESKPKSEPNKSKQSSTKVDSSTFIFGKIVSIDDCSKAKVLLIDGREGSFPTNFKYYGKIGDKVRLSIKFENKEKGILIFNLINIHFEKDDDVIGIISGFGLKVIYVTVPYIKMATIPKGFNHTELRVGMKVSCSIFKTFDFIDKEKKNITGLVANLTFNSIIY